jgi:MoxR-like ATPase
MPRKKPREEASVEDILAELPISLSRKKKAKKKAPPKKKQPVKAPEKKEPKKKPPAKRAAPSKKKPKKAPSLKKKPPEPKPTSLFDAVNEKFKKLYMDGLTYEEIAKELNISPATVGKWKKKLGLKERKGSKIRKIIRNGEKPKPPPDEKKPAVVVATKVERKAPDSGKSAQVKKYSEKFHEVKAEVEKGVLGLSEVVSSMLQCMICSGHALLEGVPGTAKTLTVMLLSETIDGAVYQRIQFTPDLLPSDITGVTIYQKGIGFKVRRGPIFGNIIAADEINRTPPKTQSAMLQAMQEREVTIGKETFALPKPFFVLATQNPLETRGVYPLPEAQVDRFLFKFDIGYVSREAEKSVIDQNVEVLNIKDFKIRKVWNLAEVVKLQSFVKEIHSSEPIKRYIVRLVDATRHPDKYEVQVGKYVRWGASPRASINLNLAAKANALMNGRTYVIPEDVKEIAQNVLRHRIILNYEGKAKGIKTDAFIDEILSKVPVA